MVKQSDTPAEKGTVVVVFNDAMTATATVVSPLGLEDRAAFAGRGQLDGARDGGVHPRVVVA